MDFSFTDEQQELKREAGRWLADRYPLDRDWEASTDAWAELAELGWLGVSIDEAYGGAGGGSATRSWRAKRTSRRTSGASAAGSPGWK